MNESNEANYGSNYSKKILENCLFFLFIGTLFLVSMIITMTADTHHHHRSNRFVSN